MKLIPSEKWLRPSDPVSVTIDDADQDEEDLKGR